LFGGASLVSWLQALPAILDLEQGFRALGVGYVLDLINVIQRRATAHDFFMFGSWSYHFDFLYMTFEDLKLLVQQTSNP